MTKLTAEISIAKSIPSYIELKVDFKFQDLTTYNQVYFALELWATTLLTQAAGKASEYGLVAEETTYIDQEFDNFKKISQLANREWLLSITTKGRDLDEAGREFVLSHFTDWMPTQSVRWSNVQ